MSDFAEYNALSEPHKKCLSATNFWRIVNGMSIIDVPKTDKEYYKYWNQGREAKAIETRKNKMRIEAISPARAQVQMPEIEIIEMPVQQKAVRNTNKKTSTGGAGLF